MASTYSNSLRLELMGTGEQAGTWGSTTNRNLGTLLEQAISGVQTVTITGNTTLTANDGQIDQSRNMVLEVNGTISGAASIFIPAQEKIYIVKNSTVGGHNINIQVTGPTGVAVSIPNGKTAIVYSTGANVYIASNFADNFDVGNISISGNTISSTDTNGNIIITPNGTGEITLSKDVTASSNLTVTGNTVLNGNTTVGNASGDTTTINGTNISAPNGLNIDTNTLVLDQTNNRIGVGVASPQSSLHVSGRTITGDFTIGGASGYQFPGSAGTSSQILQLNSSGNMQFVDIGSIGAWSTVGKVTSAGANSMTAFSSTNYDVYWAVYRLIYNTNIASDFRVGLVDSGGTRVSASNIFNNSYIYQDVSSAGTVTSTNVQVSANANAIIGSSPAPSSATDVIVEGTVYLVRSPGYSTGQNYYGNSQSTSTKDGGASGTIAQTTQSYFKEASANSTAVFGLIFTQQGGGTLKSGSRVDVYGAAFPS
tara:strand:+ start:1011 stop:2456 length:1446 start_codon:yes stop_codon:yes gene_type:complete